MDYYGDALASASSNGLGTRQWCTGTVGGPEYETAEDLHSNSRLQRRTHETRKIDENAHIDTPLASANPGTHLHYTSAPIYRRSDQKHIRLGYTCDTSANDTTLTSLVGHFFALLVLLCACLSWSGYARRDGTVHLFPGKAACLL